jgi:hypothetical protein
MVNVRVFSNPFKPGAGHMPPHLAGREEEKREFTRFLDQDTILQNPILTGLRGTGKTVLLETFKPMAIEKGWLWVGTDLSESVSINETNMALRLLTDLAVVTSGVIYLTQEKKPAGLTAPTETKYVTFEFRTLLYLYTEAPGLPSDKLKAVLELVWAHLSKQNARGVIFAYDEAQNLADQAADKQFPLSMLLDVFQSIQRKGIPLMLVLTGLPTLLPKLVEARTYAERMFHVITLDRLTEKESHDAIIKPIQHANCPVTFSPEAVTNIYGITAGYPYFIQYVCREVYDVWTQKAAAGEDTPPIPVRDILRKLDADFFAGRWARATDRQRDLLKIIATLDNAASEFSVAEVVERAEAMRKGGLLAKSFSSSHVNQMLATLSDNGFVYKNRRGQYSLAVPLLDQFIKRLYNLVA